MIFHFIRANQIDSFQKLRLLLFLYRHPGLRADVGELAGSLCLGDHLLMTTIVLELQAVGLLDCREGRWALVDEPQVRRCLHGLAQAYDCPLSRQALLAQVRRWQPAEG